MKRSKFSEQQIAFILRQAEEGTSVDEVCRKTGISRQTYYRWRENYGCVSARTIARLMTVGRDSLSKAETVMVAAIEKSVPLLVEAQSLIANFQAMVRKKAPADLEA